MRTLDEIGADIANVLRTRQHLATELEVANVELRNLEAEALAWTPSMDTTPPAPRRPSWLNRGHEVL